MGGLWLSTAKGYLQTGAGCSARTGRLRAGSGGKFGPDELKVVLVTTGTHPSQRSQTARPRRLRLSSPERAIPTPAFKK